MLITNCVLDSEGNYDFDLKVDSDETAFLVDYAVRDLIHQGVLKISFEEAQQELELLQEAGGKVN